MSKPDFNEFPRWSDNCEDRDGTKVDLILLHTEEGHFGDPNAALNLAIWMENNGVSYHNTISQAPDGGVTVVNVVDTDQASWSVLSANSHSINYCFAGSSVNDSRDKWMARSKAIDAAAWLAASDAVKYGVKGVVIPPPYPVGPPGVSDHGFVTKKLGIGDHTDVGPNFPWDYFTKKFNEYYAELSKAAPPVVVPPVVVPAATNQEKFDELTGLFPTLSEYGADPANPWKGKLSDYIRAIDARLYRQEVHELALAGDKDALALVKREADKGNVLSKSVYERATHG